MGLEVPRDGGLEILQFPASEERRLLELFNLKAETKEPELADKSLVFTPLVLPKSLSRDAPTVNHPVSQAEGKRDVPHSQNNTPCRVIKSKNGGWRYAGSCKARCGAQNA